LTGGSPASGKTTFLKTYAPYLLKEDIFHVDADEIRAMLPEYEGWNATATHLETKDIVSRLLTGDEITKPCKHDLIYDGTMNSAKNYLPLIGMLKQLGYKIFIIYMDNVPYPVVKQRMIERYKNHGRFVPIEVIDDFFGKGKDALYELRNKVDGYMIVDASDKDYKIIEQGGIKLPKERSYSEMQTKEIENNPNVEPTNTDIQNTIDGLEVLLEFSQGKEALDIRDTIDGLKILLEFA
jgi:predicted ABC-type ATPase